MALNCQIRGVSMKSTEKKLILVSLALALLAALTVFIYLNSLKAPKVSIPKMKIIVATENIPPRTLIDKKMTTELEVPQSKVQPQYISDYTKIIGRYTKETILKNEGFLSEKLLDENENNNELSLKIDGKHRAVSINVTGSTGVANLIKAGDFVDVILYLSEKKDGAITIRPDMAKILLQNVEILAIDKQMERENKLKDDTVMPTNFFVTLSVPVIDVEKLVLSEDIGSLNLVLRPLKKEKNVNTDGITASQLLSEPVDKLIGNAKTLVDTKSSFNTATSLEKKKITAEKKYKYKYYKIKLGDTLRNISRIYYGKPDNYLLLKKINNVKDENNIAVGKTIKIPILGKQR
jgi:pilus assembly protein CpaB